MMNEASRTDLWTEWAQHYVRSGIDPGRICKDGIIDPESYGQVATKLLFILKETNDFPDDDLSAFLRDGPRFQMWHSLARWAVGIQLGFPSFEKVDALEVQRAALRSCAVVNLKKTAGGAAADMAVINAYAHHDRHLLLRQVSEIKPNGIVACGTFDSVLWLLDLRCDPESPTAQIVRDPVRGCWVLPWCHPGRVDNRKTYERLGVLLADASGHGNKVGV